MLGAAVAGGFSVGVWTFQTNFTRGELDPQLAGRNDLAAYYSGVKQATNILTSPQGGARKRPGMEHVDFSGNDGRLELFSFNNEQNYLIEIASDARIKVYKNDALQVSFVTPYSSIEVIRDLDYIQSADTAIFLHEDFQPRILTREDDVTWNLDLISLNNIPQFDFNDGSSPTPTNEVQTLQFVDQTEGDRYKLSLEGILSDELVFAGDDAANEANIAQALLGLFNTGSSGIAVTTDVTLDTYRVTFSGESSSAWQLITATPIFTSLTTFKVLAVRIGVAGASRSEDEFSATRGWPRTGSFHEGRLWFGGTKSRPSTVYASRVGDFFNFDGGKGRDDEAIVVTIDTDQVNSIEAIFSNRGLQIFTSGGEFVVKDSPITPSKIAILLQSNLGSKRVRPVTIDGVTLFVQRTGKAINQFVFINEFQSNQTRSVSILSSHLIKNPHEIVASRGTARNDSNYVYIVNEDGNVTVFNTLISEDVTAFTSWETDGDIKSVAVVDNVAYFLVSRIINGVEKITIEKENDTLNMDSATIEAGLNSDTLLDIGRLEGHTVKVKADGVIMPDETVESSKITIGRVANTIEVGLEFLPILKTMPLNMQLQDGPNAASKKKILRASVNLFKSNGIIINGNRISDKTIGKNQFDAPAPQTGTRRIFLSGWSIEADITLTQDTAMPFNILSLGLEVKV